jgi:acyl carrier protein phosphodiesterase
VNYLAHLFLAGSRPLDVVANLMGDFVRGPVDRRFDVRFHDGIRLHRQIDSFTDSHPIFVRSRLRLSARHRRFSALIMDVYYDHLLARNWDVYSAEPLERFTYRTYRILAAHHHLMPPSMQRRVTGMIKNNLLVAYRDKATTASVLVAIEKRFRRPVTLADAVVDLMRSDSAIEKDFCHFFPELQTFVRDRSQQPLTKRGTV